MATLPIEGWDALYRATDQPKNMILSFSDGTTLRNPQIVLEQMSLEESLCSEENLRFGCCESSCFQIRVVNNEQSFEGLYLNVVQAFPPQLVRLIGSDDSYIIDDQGDYISGADIFYAQYGNFLVVSDKPTGDRLYRDLTCYDKMYEIIHANVIEWYDGLTFPISVKDFRDSFFEYLNVAQVETDLINDDFMIQGEFYVSEELSGRMVIESICELNGAFGHINRDGLFEYITLPTEDSLTYPHYVNGTCAYEDYETEAITGIRAINVEGDSGTVVGTEVNPYIMQSNILTFGSEGSEELMDALNNMLDLVSQFTYTPFKVTTYGNPMLPLGTNVTFETRYKTINSFVMTRYLSGLQALRDTFTALGDRMYPQDVNRIKNEIQRSGGLTHKLTNDVNTLDSEIFDDQGNSRITQTLEEIVLKVDTDGNLVQAELGIDPDTVQTYFKVGADNISFIANDTIELTSNNIAINSTDFQLTKDGDMTCNNANVNGTIVSSDGTIGGWTITTEGLISPNSNIQMLSSVQYGTEVIRLRDSTNGYSLLLNEKGIYWNSDSVLIQYPVIYRDSGKISVQGEVGAFRDGTYGDTVSNTRGKVMHGRGDTHAYQCLWSGSQLQLWVDTTNVANVSDKRLKEDIKEINPNLVKAICECKTYQYKAFNRGGLISVGIIAQDFVANCEKYGLNPMDYEVCQKGIFKADDDTEYYTIEYSQYLTLKSIHLQNQIDELKELMKK